MVFYFGNNNHCVVLFNKKNNQNRKFFRIAVTIGKRTAPLWGAAPTIASVVFQNCCDYFLVKITLAISPNAGLVINTPTNTPAMVVIAKPVNFPKPKPNTRIGSKAAIEVEAEAITIKKALLTLFTKFADSIAWTPLLNSSVITIWSPTP